MIELKEKKDCCGCGACMNICPKKCIEMKSDEEGFLYPIFDSTLCIDCGLCETVCPVRNVCPDQKKYQTGFVVQHKDSKIREESTSGGAFTAIAEYVISQGGVVFGASYDKDFMVEHSRADTEEDLAKFRNSKYVQSNTKMTFTETKKILNEGRLVCYSGTPCEIEGLKYYLQKDYSNLITVDVVCHGVPSPFIWEKYLDMQKKNLGSFKNVLFRDKYFGYKYSTMSFFNNNGENIYAYGIDTDPMTRAFFSDICDRPSCYSCVFKKRYRISDFSLWDCYNVYDFDKSMDDDKGTTRILIHSEKGRKIFDEIRESLVAKEVDSDILTKGVREMTHSVNTNVKRVEFFNDANKMSGADLFEKYFPKTMKTRIERNLRIILCKIGIYSWAKRTFTRIREAISCG